MSCPDPTVASASNLKLPNTISPVPFGSNSMSSLDCFDDIVLLMISKFKFLIVPLPDPPAVDSKLIPLSAATVSDEFCNITDIYDNMGIYDPVRQKKLGKKLRDKKRKDNKK